MLTRKIALAGVAAACVLGATVAPAGAGGGVGQLTVTPNPATTADEVTIANAPGEDSTCQSPILEVTGATASGLLAPLQVEVYVYALGVGDPVATRMAVPDGDGNWSVTVGPFATEGSYAVEAFCTFELGGKFATPARQADFGYEVAPFTVTGVPVTSPTTAAPSSTTTTAAAAATVTPRYTG